MQENLNKMEYFLKLDLKIKDLIVKMKPNNINNDEYYNIKYVDGLLEQLEKIKDYVCSVIDMLEIDEIKNIVIEKFKVYEYQIINSNYDLDKLQYLYERYILGMSFRLEEILSQNFSGFVLERNEKMVFSKCKSINDILHALHFYVVNNEKYYENMPLLDKKKNYKGWNITLYGKNNELSQELFNNLPETLDVDDTDILSFDDRIMIMVRGRGHALSLDIIEEDNDHYRINYFIPKVCSVEKVNKIKGVTKLDINNSNEYSFTKGEFVTNRNTFSSDIINLINSVPTDADMEIVKRGMNGFM